MMNEDVVSVKNFLYTAVTQISYVMVDSHNSKQGAMQ
jgi:hypothetical protein